MSFCPECGETGRLVQLPKENVEFYWCGECFVRWSSDEEPMQAPDAVARASEDVEPTSRPAHRHG